jgi:hypothetical protein
MSLYGPNAVEIQPDARIVLYRCPMELCGSKKLYLVQGTSGAVPPRYWQSENGLAHFVSQVTEGYRSQTAEVLA